MRLSGRLLLAPFALGIISTSVQVILLRELLVAFGGNELSFSIAFAVWLVSVSLGALILRKSKAVIRHFTTLATLLIMAPVISLVQVNLVRLIKPVMVGFGELPSPATILILSVIGIFPFGFIIGALFVAIVAYLERAGITKPIPFAYGIETLGSAIVGGGLAAFLLEKLDPVAITALGGMLCVVVAILLPGKPPTRKVALIALVGVLGIAIFGKRVDITTRGWEWHPLSVGASVDTRYGNIVVTSRGDMNDFYENGVLIFSAPDLFYAEETVHIPLLCHPSPHKVLILGGGGSGVVHEVAKYASIESLDYVELDPKMIDVVRRFTPPGWLSAEGVKVRAIYGDGRRYVASTHELYDVVIVNVGEPVNLQICRYYTVEFFKKVACILHAQGVLALKIPCEGAYLGPERASLISAIANACRQALGRVTILPGETIHIIASRNLEVEDRVTKLLDTLEERGIATSFITSPVIANRLFPLARAQIDSIVASFESVRPSVDDRPISFAYSIALWAKHFRSGKLLLRMIRWSGFGRWLAILTALAIVFPLGFVRGNLRCCDIVVGALAVYAMGFASMLTQVLLLLCFQVLSGYIYVKIAMLIAGFMLGMGIASLVSHKYHGKTLARDILLLQVALIVIPLGVVAIFDVLRSSKIGGFYIDLPFTILAFLTGATSGAIFARASDLLRQSSSEAEAGGLAYSLDLVGASVAGLLVGFLVVPTLGFHATAYVSALVNSIVLAGMAAIFMVSGRVRFH